jgi:hypothetical protein
METKRTEIIAFTLNEIYVKTMKTTKNGQHMQINECNTSQ